MMSVSPPNYSGHEGVIAQLNMATGRDQVINCLLEWWSERFSRVFLFVHSQDELHGRDARGDDVVLDNVKQTCISTKVHSRFAEVVALGKVYFGALAEHNPVEQAFAQALDPSKPAPVILMAPVLVHGRVPLLIVGESLHLAQPSDGQPALLARDADRICRLAGAALERIVLRRKQTNPPTS